MAQDDSWKDQPAPSDVSGIDKKTGQPYSVHIETPEPIRTGGGSKMTVPAGDLRDVGSAAEDFKTSQPSLKAIFGGKGPTVTQASQVPASSGLDSQTIQSIASSLTTPIDQSLIKAATTLVPGGHSMQMPASMMQPIAPYQERPMNTRPVVGAGNARARGIANAFTGMTNAIGAITTAKAQKEHNIISVSTERLMQAQSSIDQANQILQTDPNNKVAKDTVEKNKKVMDTILSDDKIRKGIEKGLNISFTDPSKNKTPEHGAVQAGRASFSEEFAKQMPQQMGFDPIAQARLQSAMAIQKQQMESVKAIMPYMSQLVRTQGQMNVEALKEAARAAQTNANWANKFEMLRRHQNFLGEMQDRKYKSEAQLTDRRYQDMIDAQKAIFNNKWDKEGLGKAFGKLNDSADKAINAKEDLIRKIENDMKINNIPRIMIPPNASKEVINALRAKYPQNVLEQNVMIQAAQGELQDLQRYKLDIAKQMASTGGGFDAGESDNTSDTGGDRDYNDILTWINAPVDDTPPSQENISSGSERLGGGGPAGAP